MRDKGTSDVFTRGSIELFAFIEQGSSELQQRHKFSHLEASHNVPPRLLQSGLHNDDESAEIKEHIPTWPAVEDPYVTSLVVAFHTRCGCNIATVHAYIAVLRVLQLQTLLNLDNPTPYKRDREAVVNTSDVTAISRAVTILPSLSQLFGQDILSNMCSSSSPSLSSTQQHSSKSSTSTGSSSSSKNSTGMSSAMDGVRFDFIRYCFQRLVLTGGPDELTNQAATVVSWTSEPLSSHSTVGSNNFTGSAVAANAAVVCYQLGDLWGLNVQKIRAMHMAVLLDADVSDHGLSFTSAEMCVWRDFEVENLLPLVSYNLILPPSIKNFILVKCSKSTILTTSFFIVGFFFI